MGRLERFFVFGLAVAGVALRALAFLHYRVDSDEPQHLHVAWGWTAGYVQYRDVFDNHAPLFHLLTAPLLAMLGERPDIVIWMRAPMLGLFAAALIFTFVIARRLYDSGIAVWATLLVALFPPFFLKSLEYRTDNLWNTLWLGALALLVHRTLTPGRLFFVGLVFGCALSTSMKTPLLIIALVLGAAGAGVRRAPLKNTASAIAGFVIVPAALSLLFIRLGAWDRLVYCVFEFNGQLSRVRPPVTLRRVFYPLLLAGVFFLARRHRGDPVSWRTVLALTAIMFAITLGSFWILISPRDLLPVMPLIAIFVAARVPRAGLAMIAFASIGALYYYADGFENHADEHTTMMRQVLGLTRPGEPLHDVKGETIYRPRPFYHAIELITRSQMRAGLIADTIPEDVVRARCHVAQADGPQWPPRAQAFLRSAFIDVGRLRVAGQHVAPDGSFTITIPGEYVVVTENGLVQGPRELLPGTYRFPRPGAPNTMVVMWAPAFARGYSPFHPRDLDFWRTLRSR